MSDLEQRVKALESKVKVLEETLETLKNMSLSEQMGSFIQSRQKSLRMVELLNSVSEDDKLDFEKERASLNNVRTAKQSIDAQISQALRNSGTFSDDFPDDPRYFNYEVETGRETYSLVPELERFAGKGLRITSYNGFETNRVIIPREINGQPVISIGEKAFMNASVSEVVLPTSIKAILSKAFSGCKNLKKIDLPDAIEYLGPSCFSQSGLTELAFPNSLKSIPSYCCLNCSELETISIGQQVEKIKKGAFHGCSKIRSVTLPEKLSEIEDWAFTGTSITTIIFPSEMKFVAKYIFSFTHSDEKVNCVFLGKDTKIDGKLENVSLIYCLPGSNIQQAARENSIPIKPLSEFRMEDYQ